MPRVKKSDFDEYKYQQQYIKENLRFVNVPFNSKFPEEMELYDHLNDHAKATGEKKGAYIKRLIREDMQKAPKRISVDNGHTFVDPKTAIEAVGWDTIVAVMDDELRESLHDQLAPCSYEAFLTAYLAVAPVDLVIG